MNDPGLDEPAAQAAQDIEKNVYEADQLQAEEEEQDFLDPSAWWIASTASPLLAGTFGPVANAFSICALVENWRVYIPSGADEAHGENVKDPKWLIAINSISLVFALIANMALLLNMARRLSFNIAQPITITGFYLASILLIVLVALASTSIFRIEPRAEHALTQAYYYGIMAAGLYFVIASLMVVTVHGAYKGHYPKEFRLTPSQRTLMLQTISFVVYLLLGALVFSTVENWRFLDAVYWADFTLLTIGIGGEYVPMTHIGRSLLFPYAIGGIIMVGLVIGSVRSLVLERAKQKMSARFMESERQRVIALLDRGERSIRIGLFENIRLREEGKSETHRREQEFRIMRRVQQVAERNRRYVALAMSATAAMILWFIGALVFMKSEKPQGWSYFISLYFAYTSLLTIGYGDYTLSSNSSRAFFVFWSLLAIPTLTVLISNMGDTVIKAFRDLTMWVGSLTVLPDEKGAMSAFKVGVKRLRSGKLSQEKGEIGTVTHATGEQVAMDRLTEHIEEDELAEADEAEERGDILERDIHFYHFILAKEIGQLMRDIDASPPKQYTYQEWSYYLRLLGQDEADASNHRKPNGNHDTEDHKHPDIGRADGGEGSDDKLRWSWLGVRSPLMGNKTEAQWLLHRLSARLTLEMRNMRKDQKESPPISMSDLRKKRTSDSNGSPKQELQNGLGAAEVRRRHHGDGVKA
ncbi:potassium channel-like protein [Amniculicola lignicola CBS 123094]|uniref:Potassium channel-like protein n=1 Tax=Amniculicola lignicola CBS 123094 TaxID=1392246 RepID=A0A6A5X329_9PLEO|nr:potassium channel-like protein [Amniculicola lignicola CBS 123094]